MLLNLMRALVLVLFILTAEGFRLGPGWTHSKPLYSSINNREHDEGTKRNHRKNTITTTPTTPPRTTGVKKAEQLSIVKPKIKRPQLKRIPLDDLSVGQKVKGRVISIAAYGLYVDVGTSRDGLLHIKEVSNSYFVQDLESKFYPGQDIDVWVKLADKEANKLQLQLYPMKLQETNQKPQETISVDELEEMQLIVGTAVKYSNFGIFLDIGLGMSPLLSNIDTCKTYRHV
jgi:predicted RNA-binding protein with RPS1 domain